MKDMVRNVRAAAKEMHALMCKIQKRASGPLLSLQSIAIKLDTTLYHAILPKGYLCNWPKLGFSIRL